MNKEHPFQNQTPPLRIPDLDGVYPLPPISNPPSWFAIVVRGPNRFFVGPNIKESFRGARFQTPDGRDIVLEKQPPALKPIVPAFEQTAKLAFESSRVSRLLRPDGSAVEITQPLTTIGRQRWCDLTLMDSAVSNLHCVIVCSAQATYLLDAQSLNGSLVNRQPIRCTSLAPGDLIQLGNTRFLAAEAGLGDFKGGIIHLNSPAMQEVDRLTARMAPSNAPVLIQGETGVGKESVAAAIHRRSGRKGGFVALNAATLRPELAASTLFGHRKGAFTGAVHDAGGAFKSADQGTLFLDEVAELSPEVQSKLLRVIETGEIRPVGAVTPIRVDVRIVTATHKDLPLEVQSGEFREDLFHRICVLPLMVPPLRARPDDIHALADNFLKSQRPPRSLSKAAERKLLNHSWPGNIRELINTLRRACVLCHSPVLPPTEIQFLASTASETPLERFLHTCIVDTYKRNRRNVAQTAKALGIHRTTASRHLKAAGLL